MIDYAVLKLIEGKAADCPDDQVMDEMFGVVAHHIQQADAAGWMHWSELGQMPLPLQGGTTLRQFKPKPIYGAGYSARTRGLFGPTHFWDKIDSADEKVGCWCLTKPIRRDRKLLHPPQWGIVSISRTRQDRGVLTVSIKTCPPHKVWQALRDHPQVILDDLCHQLQEAAERDHHRAEYTAQLSCELRSLAHIIRNTRPSSTS